MAQHLTESDVRMALRQGRAIEQWLGARIDDGDRLLKWLRIHVARPDRYVVTVFEVFDEGSAGFTDIVEFASFDPDEPYGHADEFATADEAIAFAIDHAGASSTAFVNSGMAADAYRQFIAAEGFWHWAGRF